MDRPHRTVLLVATNPADCAVIQRDLEDDSAAEYSCIMAPTLAAVHAFCQAGLPDALVLDAPLPDTALAWHADLVGTYGQHAFAIILLLDTASPTSAARILKCGIHDYVLKRPGLAYTLGHALDRAIIQLALQRELAASQRRREAPALSRSQLAAFSQAVLDSLSAHIVVLDRDGRILAVNAAWEAFGRKNGRANQPGLANADVGINYLAVCRACANAGLADAQAAYEGVCAVLSGQQPSFTLEYRCDRPDSPAWFVMSVTQLAGHAGAVVAHTDLTARRLAEAALHQSEQTLKLFVEHAPAAIAMFDRTMRYMAVSRRYLADYRLGDQNIIGQSHYSVFPNIPERWKAIHQRCLTGMYEANEEDLFPRGDGVVDWVRWELHPWYENFPEIGGLILFSEVITERKRAEDALRASRQQLMDLSVRLVNAQENERRALAYELHDEIGQQLTCLNMVLEIGTHAPAEQQRTRLHEAQRLVADLTGQVRRLSLDLRPPMLDDMGLLPTLLWHFQRYTQQTNVIVDFRYGGLAHALPPHIAIGAYRIVQEGLTNVARHAQTTIASVRVWVSAGQLKITIEDQGCGFDTAAASLIGPSVGVTGMYERAQLLGGQFSLDSTPGEGTCIRVTLPLDMAQAAPGAA